VKFRKVAVFKTLTKVKWIGQMFIDDEQMLLDIVIWKQFRAKEAFVESIKRIY
jgi:hypothetical protein